MDLTAIIGVLTYDLADGSVYRLVVHDGLGMSALHRLTERGPQQHGESDVGFRLDPRFFTLVWEVEGSDRSDLDDRRDHLLRVLKPMDDAVTLRFTLDNGDVRQIDANVLGAPMTHDAGERYAALRIGAQFSAPDPTFYHPTEENVIFALGGGSGTGTEVPLPVPLPVGVSSLDQTRTIAYSGSFRTYPIIKIVGPVTDCIVTNQLTDEKLDFTGTTIAAGDYYEIDCRYGYKTVVDSGGTNQIPDLTIDSDLVTFHIEAPEGAEAVRNNSIRVEGESITAATEVYVRYKLRYVGI